MRRSLPIVLPGTSRVLAVGPVAVVFVTFGVAAISNLTTSMDIGYAAAALIATAVWAAFDVMGLLQLGFTASVF
jgi:MFS superfamily sulfate permease-like transporter